MICLLFAVYVNFCITISHWKSLQKLKSNGILFFLSYNFKLHILKYFIEHSKIYEIKYFYNFKFTNKIRQSKFEYKKMTTTQ